MSLANARTVWRLVALETYDKKEKLVYDQAGYTGNSNSFPPPPGPQVIFPQQTLFIFLKMSLYPTYLVSGPK